MEPRPAEGEGPDQGKCWTQNLLERDSSKWKGLEAAVGWGEVSQNRKQGPEGRKYSEQGENGRSQVRWGPGGQHGRLLWVMTVLRSLWATPEKRI